MVISSEPEAVEQNLWEIFTSVAAVIPEREAIVWRERRIDYATLLERPAGSLTSSANADSAPTRKGKGWPAGKPARTQLAYTSSTVPSTLKYLGGYGARTAPFNVNYRYVAEELAYLLEDAQTTALVYHARFAPTLADVLPRLSRKPLLLQVDDESNHALLPGAFDYETALFQAASNQPDLDHSPDDLYLLYTGGTTGMPKGTMWRQADIWVAALGAEADPEI